MSPIPPYAAPGGSSAPVAPTVAPDNYQIVEADQVVLAMGDTVILPDFVDVPDGWTVSIVDGAGSATPSAPTTIDGGGVYPINGAYTLTIIEARGGYTFVKSESEGQWFAIDKPAWDAIGNQVVTDFFQSANYAGGGGVWAANEIADGDQWASKGLAPAGVSTWQNGVVNPSSDLSALLHIEVKATPISITPPVDGTTFRVRRVAIMTFDGQQDVDLFTYDGTYDASKGAFYVPAMNLVINRAVGAGHSSAVVITDELQVDWSGPGNLPIYPQNPFSRGTVQGRIG